MFLLGIYICSANLYSYNPKKVVSDIRGSYIKAIFQDSKGLIWVNTNVGVSTYDGKTAISITGLKGTVSLQENVPENMLVGTVSGFKILNRERTPIETYDIFNNVNFSASDSRGTIFIVQDNGFIYYKKPSQKHFDNFIIPDLVADRVKLFFVTKDDVLWIVTNDGMLRSFNVVNNNASVNLKEKIRKKISTGVVTTFKSDNDIYMLDSDYKLRRYNLNRQDASFVSDLHLVLKDKGKITSGIYFQDEFYFGTEKGLFVIKEDKAERLPINSGVSCLMKDKFQNLIWIGTSGDGLYAYSYDPYNIKSNLLSDFSPLVSKSITAIYYDNSKKLWLGTEGGGLITIPDYEPAKDIKEAHVLTAKNGLTDDTVYALYKSKYGLWIGCKSGLSFYSDRYKTINKIKSISLNNVRGIYEQDSLLWLACYGEGVVKANVQYNDGKPELEETKFYTLNNGEEASNRFSSIYSYSNTLWFTNSGNGVFNIVGNDLIRFKLVNSIYNSINHLTAISKGSYIATTDVGTIRFDFDNQNTNVRHLNNISTNDILPGHWNDYWLSTDNGLILYNIEFNAFHIFDNTYGLTVKEYCNGASFKDEQNNILFFGGVNGFTTVQYNEFNEAMEYMPELFLDKLSVFGIEKNISNFFDKETNIITLKPNENFFSVSFNALDYINGYNYIFYYKIGKDGQWIDNGNSGVISFTDLRPGKYELYVRYYNKILNKESYTQKLSIEVLPPWYNSVHAYVLYSLLFLTAILYIFVSVSKRKRRLKQEERLRNEQQRREEIHEAKLNFFTDIAHEFCTPLTLISGPCKLILEQQDTTSSIIRYADVIDRNAKRMHSLISDLMSFKRMESGYKQPQISKLNIAEIADHVIDAFEINTSGARIDIRKHYPKGIFWNSDEEFINTILINLLSNAVKYSEGEPIDVHIRQVGDVLTINIINQGRGIDKEYIADIFNRYTILDNYVEQSTWKQNGLGLAITASMVKLLSGSINAESIEETISFIVKLPLLQVEVDLVESGKRYDLSSTFVSEFISPPATYIYKDDRPTVAIVDDNPEMLWLICDILNNEFNVLPMSDATKAIDTLNSNYVDIILCDIMMNGIDGIKLTEILKSDKSTSHIPLIIISAAHDIEIQTKAIDAGAELYLTKPFDATYLRTSIRRLLGRKEDLKDYFASPLSAYELNMGKLQHAEYRKFLKKIYAIINKNIQNKGLSPEFIASELGMSTRNLYRKIKESTDKGLLEIIRDGKLAVAANLLLKSKFSIDEIIFKSGFSNRASFYRAFSKKYGCNPSEFIEKNGVK